MDLATTKPQTEGVILVYWNRDSKRDEKEVRKLRKLTEGAGEFLKQTNSLSRRINGSIKKQVRHYQQF